MDTTNHIEKQIQELLNNMSIREKVGQCIMIEPVFCLESLNKKSKDIEYKSITDPNFLKVLFDDYKIGFLLYGGITRIGEDHLLDWATYIEEVNKYINNNNHIPLLYGVDAVHGNNFVKETAVFSHNLGAVSSWNPSLLKEYTTVVGKELASIGMNCNFAPTIDVARDQRWGRVYESFGEDPFLASVMAKAMVEGYQSSNEVAACAKHYVGYGAANNGRDRTPADISERELREIHLPPFEEAINSGVKTIMVNGADLNGVPIPVSKRVLTDILRDELGFNGITMSDWEDVNRLVDRHKVVRSKEEAILRSFNAGLDMNMVVNDLETVDIMEKLVNEGEITIERLNEACGNILRVKLSLNLFDRKPVDIEAVRERRYYPKSKEIAKQIALESITLLKNETTLLPIDPNIKSILVTGKAANSKRHMCGGWTLNWASANEEDLNFPTILEELKNSVSKNTRITYIDSINKMSQIHIDPTQYDICISVVGEEPHSEWLGDSYNLYIEDEELNLLKAAYNTTIPVVMVSLLGRPQKMNWPSEHIPSILWAYYPGSEGAKPIVDVLFGIENPSGKTPITFPKNANQIPIVYNARRYVSWEIQTKYEPIYPFGYGLSYTTFEYTNITAPNQVYKGQNIDVTITVKNTGDRSGTEIVQLYLVDVYASVTRPMKSLKGFTKVKLEPGDEKDVTITLTPSELKLRNEYLESVEESREIDLVIGTETVRVEIL